MVEGDEEEIVYATWNEPMMLRIVKILPKVEGNKFSYGGVKLELIELLVEDGEEYELVGEIVLNNDQAAMLANVLSYIVIENVNTLREKIGLLSVFTEAMNMKDEDDDRMYS